MPVVLLGMGLCMALLIGMLGWVFFRVRQEKRALEQSARQIGERLALLSERDQAQRERDIIRQRLVGAMSHDLRQPIQAMNLYLRRLDQALQAGWLPDSERGAALQARVGLRHGLSYMTGLLDGVMDVSQLVHGSLAIRAEPVCLTRFLQQLHAEQSPLFSERGGVLELQVPDQSRVWVRSDARLLERLIRNLLANALRYAPGCRVRMRAIRSGAEVRLSICDTGPGIGVHELARIRNELQRRPTGEMTPSLQGIGLGLVIARQISIRIGARLAVSSHAALGTGFMVVLPAEEDPGLLAALHPTLHMESRAPDLMSGMSAPSRVQLCVVVSAVPESRHALGVALMTDGMETLSYSSAEQALSALADLGLRPQILLIDEAADGPLAIEIAERFEEEFNDWIPTIIVSDQPRGPAGDRTRERWIRVLRRPFDPGELTALVASGTQA